MNEAFERLIPLYGQDALMQLKEKTVMIIGLGGVGATAVEALVRIGIGRLILVDGDVVQKNNLNRQLLALHSTLGKPKVEVAKIRMQDINPEVKIITHHAFYDDTKHEWLDDKLDLVLDAFDDYRLKVDLIKACKSKQIPSLHVVGAGFRIRSNQAQYGDLFKMTHDKLASKMRKLLRKAGINQEVDVIYSQEPINRDKDFKTIASSPFSPPSLGLFAAEKAVEILLRNDA